MKKMEKTKEFADMLGEQLFDDERNIFYKDRVDTLFDLAEQMVNSLTFDQRKAAELAALWPLHRVTLTAILLIWIKTFAEEENYSADGRNEQALSMIKEIAEMTAFQSVYDFYFEGFEYDETRPSFYEVGVYFAEKGKSMHKTLMQTFTGFLFSSLKELAKFSNELKEVDDVLTYMYEDNWDMMSLV